MRHRFFTTALSLVTVNLLIIATAFAAPRVPAGTGDLAGGGNGTDERIYESYIRDPRKLPAFEEHIKPIFDHLDERMRIEDPPSKNDDGEEPARMKMADYFAAKKWYFVPTELEPLSAEEIGVGILRTKTTQLAIQKERSIWINSKIFDRMSSRDQATLLMHEYVMMMYFTRFQTFGELCRMIRRAQPESFYRPRNDGCAQTEIADRLMPAEPRRRLNESDYENIRQATDWIMNNGATTTNAGLRRALRSLNFDARLWAAEERDKNEEVKIKGSEILAALKRALHGRRLPRNCTTFDGKTTACSLSFEEKKFPMTFTDSSPTSSTFGRKYEVELPGVDIRVRGDDWSIGHHQLLADENAISALVDGKTGQKLYLLTGIPMLKTAEARPGDVRHTLFVYFKKIAEWGAQHERYEIVAVVVQPVVVVEVDPAAPATRSSQCTAEKLDEESVRERPFAMVAPRAEFADYFRNITTIYPAMVHCR